ncbi:9937_t:CDS:2, partial [Gigaspora rosea]
MVYISPSTQERHYNGRVLEFKSILEPESLEEFEGSVEPESP